MFRVIQADGVIQCDKCDSLNVTTVDTAASQEWRGWKNQCSVSECPYWANRNGTFQKKKKLNFRADIIINDFLPPTFLLLIALNYISPATVFFDPSSTGHGPGKLATVPYLFRKHYQKFQPSLMYPEGVGSHVDSDKEEAWQ